MAPPSSYTVASKLGADLSVGLDAYSIEIK
jgi:hypothetical protein